MASLSEEAHAQYGGDVFSLSPMPLRKVPSLLSFAAHTLTPTERLVKLLGHLGEGQPGSRAGSISGAAMPHCYGYGYGWIHDADDPRHS